MLSKGATTAVLALVLVTSTVWPVMSYVVNKPEKADRVRISLYDEYLCPGCRRFVREQLGPTWDKLQDIMEVEVTAYGWAEESPLGKGYNFTCQHGPDECTGNMVLECAKAHFPSKELFLHFTVCLMSQKDDPLPPPFAVGRKCARSLKVKWRPIKKCATSLEGQLLLHEAGVKFHSLQNPEPEWVPWILVNDKPNDKAQEDLKGIVCSTYQGVPPDVCNE